MAKNGSNSYGPIPFGTNVSADKSTFLLEPRCFRGELLKKSIFFRCHFIKTDHNYKAAFISQISVKSDTLPNEYSFFLKYVF